MVSRGSSAASRAAYNDILLRTVTPDAVGGVLLTPAVVKPKQSPEDWAIQQAIGLAGLSKPQPVVHGLPDRAPRTVARSPSVYSDDETEYTDSMFDGARSVQAGSKAVDTEILELLVRLAVLEAEQSQQPTSVAQAVVASTQPAAAVASHKSRKDSLDSTPPVVVDVELPPLTNTSSQGKYRLIRNFVGLEPSRPYVSTVRSATTYLTSHLPKWQSDLKQGYDLAISTMLTALRDCDGNHAVISALADAVAFR
jgi:hypothetical protein